MSDPYYRESKEFITELLNNYMTNAEKFQNLKDEFFCDEFQIYCIFLNYLDRMEIRYSKEDGRLIASYIRTAMMVKRGCYRFS